LIDDLIAGVVPIFVCGLLADCTGATVPTTMSDSWRSDGRW
jgi:hypothetical protein